jgi:F-type H+-transporting ATPase subunit b
MHFEAEHAVALGFFLFLAVLAYYGVHRMIVGALDARINGVKEELAAAEKLRADAQALLASFEAKRKAAEDEAAGIVAQAKTEAEAMQKEAQARLAEFVARRTKQAEDKIANAEAQAAADVRAAAADAAVRAAEAVLKTETTGQTAANLVDQGIKQIARLAS